MPLFTESFSPQFMNALTQQNQLMSLQMQSNLFGIPNQSLLQHQPNFGVAPLTFMPNFTAFAHQQTNQLNLPFNNNFGGQFCFPTPAVPIVNLQNGGLYQQQPGVPIMNVQNGGLYQQQPMMLMTSKKQSSNPQNSKQTQYSNLQTSKQTYFSNFMIKY